MAVPTISGISPVSGPAGGRNVVIISGTNFKLTATPPTTGPVGALIKTVRVKFGGEEVRGTPLVTASTEIRVEVPAYRGSTEVDPIVAVAVEVANLDSTGAVIPGELVTLSSAYTYIRPKIRPPTATQDTQIWQKIVENVVALFRRQVHKNTQLQNVHTDWSESGTNVTFIASLPNLSISGPKFVKDPWRSTQHVRDTFNTGINKWERFWPPFVYTLEFGLLGISDSKSEALGMLQGTIELFMRNGFLSVDKTPSTPTLGREKFVLCLDEPPQFQPGQPGSNLHIFSATFTVKGVHFELPEAFAQVEDVDTLEQQNQLLGGTLLPEIKVF